MNHERMNTHCNQINFCSLHDPIYKYSILILIFSVDADFLHDMEHKFKRIKSELRNDNADTTNTDDNNILKCKQCKFIATKTLSLQLHQFVHSTKPPYLCTICDYKTSKTFNFNKHVLTHSKDKPYKCPRCSGSFRQNGSLNTHMKSKHPDSIIKCAECDFSACLPTMMNSHKMRYHSKSKQAESVRSTIFECDQCGFSTYVLSMMIEHKLEII